MIPIAPEWTEHLRAVAAAALECQESAHFEVRLRAGSAVFGLSFPSGDVTDGNAATCSVEGPPGALQSVIKGERTLQSAHTSGAVHLSGNPDHLLRFSMLLDRCRQSQ